MDGLIILGASSNPRPPLQGIPDGFALVYAYGAPVDPRDMSVASDAGRIAGQRLLDLGR
ncbi:hypothetical protein [Actinoplanes aureus]|uniref:Uncharacterized protein n=1 Tax=Actinoplanes aureus TaxID=2792083 RepID=A0A931G264_9ACTN|nr:hypothetical protein [Actinoplanes aureus]MBG0567357.1 hypothetical protein [Actinoplanes aureus]